MSTPRVGWAGVSTPGPPESSLARTAFCWLPPEREPALASGSAGRPTRWIVYSERTLPEPPETQTEDQREKERVFLSVDM